MASNDHLRSPDSRKIFETPSPNKRDTDSSPPKNRNVKPSRIPEPQQLKKTFRKSKPTGESRALDQALGGFWQSFPSWDRSSSSPVPENPSQTEDMATSEVTEQPTLSSRLNSIDSNSSLLEISKPRLIADITLDKSQHREPRDESPEVPNRPADGSSHTQPDAHHSPAIQPSNVSQIRSNPEFRPTGKESNVHFNYADLKEAVKKLSPRIEEPELLPNRNHDIKEASNPAASIESTEPDATEKNPSPYEIARLHVETITQELSAIKAQLVQVDAKFSHLQRAGREKDRHTDARALILGILVILLYKARWDLLVEAVAAYGMQAGMNEHLALVLLPGLILACIMVILAI